MSRLDFRRIELHNHSTESDGSLTIEELADYAVQHEFGAMVLTDHNTISGHTKLDRTIKSRSLPLEALHGLELTTYKGHILCLDIERYIPWSDINPKRPEILFDRVREARGLVGVAHPFSLGAPLATGCEWVMDIGDYGSLDFIEVVNNSAKLPMINQSGLDWWQDLVLQGHRLAATSGIDLHRPVAMDGFFTTYLPVPRAGLRLSQLLRNAITRQQTVVTRGPVFYATAVRGDVQERQELRGDVEQQGRLTAVHVEIRSDIDAFTRRSVIGNSNRVIELVTPVGRRVIPCPGGQQHTFSFPLEWEEQQAQVLILKLYDNDEDNLRLLALAPPVWMDDQP